MRINAFMRLLHTGKPLPLFLGFSFVIAWNQLLYASNILLLPPGNIPSLSIAHIFATLSIVIVCFGAAFASSRLTPLFCKREILHLVGFLGALASCGMSVTSAGFMDESAFIYCIAVTAGSGAWLTIAWYEQFSSQQLSGAFACYATCTILGLIIAAIVYILPKNMGIVCTVLMPVLATFSLRPIVTPVITAMTNNKEKDSSYRKLAGKTPTGMLIALGFISFTLGAIRFMQLPPDPMVFSTDVWLSVIVTNAIALVLAALFALMSFRRSVSIAFYAAISVLAFVAVTLVVPLELPGSLIGATASIGTNLIIVLVWLTLLSVINEKQVQTVWAFGLFIVSQFLGGLFGQLTALILNDNPVLLAIAMLLFLIAALFAVVGWQQKQIASTPPHSTIEIKVERLAKDKGLSAREQEILRIWATGYDTPHIARELSISKNTVKTHISHIYTKIDVGSRAEILKLLEKYENHP